MPGSKVDDPTQPNYSIGVRDHNHKSTAGRSTPENMFPTPDCQGVRQMAVVAKKGGRWQHDGTQPPAEGQPGHAIGLGSGGRAGSKQLPTIKKTDCLSERLTPTRIEGHLYLGQRRRKTNGHKIFRCSVWVVVSARAARIFLMCWLWHAERPLMHAELRGSLLGGGWSSAAAIVGVQEEAQP